MAREWRKGEADRDMGCGEISTREKVLEGIGTQ